VAHVRLNMLHSNFLFLFSVYAYIHDTIYIFLGFKVVYMVAAGNGNGNDSMGVGREWEQESHSRTPLTPSPRRYGVFLFDSLEKAK